MEKKSQSALKWLSLKETTSLDVNETWHSFSQKVVTSNLFGLVNQTSQNQQQFDKNSQTKWRSPPLNEQMLCS